MDEIDTNVILVLSGMDDSTADAVVSELDKRGARVARMDTGDFPARLRLAARNGHQGWEGTLRTDGVSVHLREIGAVYYRRPTRWTLPEGMSQGDEVLASMEARLGLGGILGALQALWVNSPARVAVAEYKPLQLQVAGQVGHRTPRTLVTNDHRALVDFAAEIGGPVICKTLSSLVLSENGQAQAIYTTPIDLKAVLPGSVAATAHLFQEWIPKDHEVRVTMIGTDPYAVAIRTESRRGRVDWRSDYGSLKYAAVDVPAEVTAAMVAYLRSFDLSFGAFDFVVDPDGAWWFLECNPGGQWLWLEEETRLPMAAAFAELLMGGKQDD